jgi:hypothetical protein
MRDMTMKHTDSEKFNQFFKYQPVAYENGIQETIKFLRSK